MRLALLRLQQFFAQIFLETPARLIGMDRLIAWLEGSGKKIERLTSRTSGRPVNQDVLAHIIGIEYWGQRRLRTALGEPPTDDESDEYRPDKADWTNLQDLFRAARQQTISLSKSLRMVGLDPTTRVPHNQFGELSLLGWLLYLLLHARIESFRIN